MMVVRVDEGFQRLKSSSSPKLALNLTHLVQPLLCGVYAYSTCSVINLIVYHNETFNVALKLAFGDV